MSGQGGIRSLGSGGFGCLSRGNVAVAVGQGTAAAQWTESLTRLDPHLPDIVSNKGRGVGWGLQVVPWGFLRGNACLGAPSEAPRNALKAPSRPHSAYFLYSSLYAGLQLSYPFYLTRGHDFYLPPLPFCLYLPNIRGF